MKYDLMVGIDPDSVKSGVACVDKDGRCEVTTLSFSDVCSYLKFIKQKETETGTKTLIVVEAGWLNPNNWHLRRGDTLPMAAAKGKSLGRCEQTGRLILEMAETYGLETLAKKPLQKCWKGKDRKITHDEIKGITGLVTGRTNQEERDALLLAWVESGFPVRVKKR